MSAQLPRARKLERLVSERAEADGIKTRRMRRWIAMIALVQVLHITRERGLLTRFLVKGGHTIELRVGSFARASRDLDIVVDVQESRESLVDVVIFALRESWSGFTFAIRKGPEYRDHCVRFEVAALYNAGDWSTFELEVAGGSAASVEAIAALDLAAFGLQEPAPIPCLALHVQTAQKLHGATNPNDDRARDLLDIYIIDTICERSDDALRDAIVKVFDERKTHDWPPSIELREGWEIEIQDLITRHGFPFTPRHVLHGVQQMVRRLLRA